MGSAELYNPSTGKFVTTGSLNTPRFLHIANLLATGQVLIAGGYESQIRAWLASAEPYQ